MWREPLQLLTLNVLTIRLTLEIGLIVRIEFECVCWCPKSMTQPLKVIVVTADKLKSLILLLFC